MVSSDEIVRKVHEYARKYAESHVEIVSSSFTFLKSLWLFVSKRWDVFLIPFVAYYILSFVYKWLRRKLFANKKRTINGMVVLITGGSRGMGKGIAIECAKAGAKVYITGRSTGAASSDDAKRFGGTITDTAKLINSIEGIKPESCVPIKCDHYNDDEVKKTIRDIIAKEGKIDVLINNVIHITWKGQRPPLWRDVDDTSMIFDAYWKVGMRSHVIASSLVIPHMISNAKKDKRKKNVGLIINISSPGEISYIFNTPYGIAKAGVKKFKEDLAIELKRYRTGVSCMTIWPGVVKTERMIAKKRGLKNKLGINIETGETTGFTGRAVVALINDRKHWMELNGKTKETCVLAQHYNFTDENGRIPFSVVTQRFWYMLVNFKTIVPFTIKRILGIKPKENKKSRGDDGKEKKE